MRHCFKLLLLTTALMAWFATSAQDATPLPVTEAAALINAEQIKPELVKQKAIDTKMVSVPQEEAISTQKPATSTTSLKVANKNQGSQNGPKRAPRRAEVVTPPSSIIENAEDWNISTNFYNVGYGDFIPFDESVKVAISGNDIYIAGLCLWLPDAWIHGTIDGNTATFTSGQYYGSFTQSGTAYDMYFVGWDTFETAVSDVTFTYNPTTKNLKLVDDMQIRVAPNTESGYYAYHLNTVIAKEYVEPPVEVQLADGTSPSSIIPICGQRYGNSTTSQMIYPASMLTDFEDGQRINSVTFYTNDNGIKFSGGQITVTIGTTTNTYFEGNTALTINDSKTATVTPTNGSKSLMVTFSDPLVYTAGSNIIIQMVNTTTGTASATTWFGVQYNSGDTYYSYSSRGNINNWSQYLDEAARLRFLPKATFELQNPPAVLTDELDFGTIEVGNSNTLTAYVENTNSSAVTATVTTSSPFSVTSTTVTLQPGATGIPVTFTPTDSYFYEGTLTVEYNGTTITINLIGTGNKTGSLAIRDSEFFDGITYKWKDDNGNVHTSKLTDVATETNQIIAMLREVYTNKRVPGNFKRGCDANGNFTETYGDVSYPAIGTLNISPESTSDLTTPSKYTYEDSYGWNIPNKKPVKCNTVSYSSGGWSSTNYTTYYTSFDQTEYKPNNEGVTLVLIEVPDDFDRQTSVSDFNDVWDNTNEGYLKYFISKTVKSARIVTNAMRTGSGQDAGTLFKVDCDKMNKFFFLAKGQLRMPFNSKMYYDSSSKDYLYFQNCTFMPYPFVCYTKGYYGNSNYSTFSWFDYSNSTPFFNMFEQFSPVSLETGDDASDLYWWLVRKKSFKVFHDCVSVPLAYTSDETQGHGHQFMMYGQESGDADCQDVRDLMFFVPDYRMMQYDGRDNGDVLLYQNYNTVHQPTMGLYVIIQDEIVPTTEADDYYMLTLTWDSNLDEFLPSNQQEYELLEVKIDENGNEVYVPVYYMNAQGQYTDAQGNLVSTPVPVVLTLNPGDNKVYTQVYVPREDASQQVTYVIRGKDKADPQTGKSFLSLKVSNRQSYIIPGKDPAELVFLKDATHYSRFDAENVRNCYSNKLLINNNVAGLKADAINGKHLYITRQGFGETEPTTVATITFNASNKSYTVQMANQAAKTDFPACSSNESEEPVAGYHANRNNTVGNGQWTGTYDVPSNSNIVDLGKLIIFDNFVVDVSQNAHPTSYTYSITSDYPVEIQGGNTASAHSNTFTVPVYKTDSRVSGTFSASQVDGDNAHALPLDDISFDAKVQYSSKTEILRYDAYRWNESDTRYIVESADAHDDEQDIAPNGIAGNQDGYYTVSMNEVGTSDYATSTVSVAMGETDKWANFVDKYPKSHAGDYIYVPVVETFTFGKKVDETSDRDDYNTYGGPLQRAASATLQLSLAGAEESDYYWVEDGNKYNYYNIKLKVEDLTMPDENGTYNVYKVRAWRKVDPSFLNENNPGLTSAEIQSRQARKGDINGEYLFEELGYEDVSASILQNNYVFGSEVFDANHSEDLKMTFGAQRVALSTDTDKSGTIEELPIEFVVRVYFTLAENLTSQGSGNGAPRRAQAEPQYYIAEQTFTTSMTGENVVTAVNSVNVNREVKSVTYVNSLGMQSSQPFSGVNVVVTRYTDGTTTTTKIVK